MNVILPLLVVLPLAAAAVSIMVWRALRFQQALAIATLVALIGMTATVLTVAAREGAQAVTLGGWPGAIGISLVGDVFSGLLLLVSLLVVFVVLLYAIAQPRDDKTAFYFHPLYLVLAAGVTLSFLSADLFNLFVAIEIMLSASYALITIGGRAAQIRAGMSYVVINLLASTLLVTAIALIYAATGSLDLADLSTRLSTIDPAVADALGVFLLVALGIKAAIFPLFFWLPDAYPTAPVTVTAVFAGLLTKVGVYAIIRTQTLLFPFDGPDTLLLWLSGLTMLVGVLGAIAQDEIKRNLSFNIVSGVGYMLLGLALGSPLGLAATTLYMVHHIPVMTGLFLVDGLVEAGSGTGALRRLGGLLRSSPTTAGLFLLVAASFAGIPPFSGFLGKLALVQAGMDARAWTITLVALAVSVLTVFSMTRIWSAVFWGHPKTGPEAAPFDPPRPVPRLMTASTAVLVAVTLAIALGGGAVWDLAEQAGIALSDRTAYVSAVLGDAP